MKLGALLSLVDPRLSVVRKLWLGVGVLVLVLVAGAIFMDWTHSSTQKELHQMIEVANPMSEATYEMEINANGIYGAVLAYLHDPEPLHAERIDDDTADFERAFAQYLELADNPVRVELGRQVRAGFDRLRALATGLQAVEDRQAQDLEHLRHQLAAIDSLVEANVQAAVPGAAGRLMPKLSAALDLDTTTDAFAEEIGAGIQSGEVLSEERLASFGEDSRRRLEHLRSFNLTAEEAVRADEIGVRLEESLRLAAAIVASYRSEEEGIAKLVATREALDHWLDEGIQVEARRELAASLDSAHQAAGIGRFIQIVLGLGASFAAVGVTFLVGHEIAQRVQALAAGAAEIGAGNLAHRIPVQGRDELGQLAAAFNAMAQSRQDALQELQGAHQGLEERVRTRTAELEALNQRLQHEIGERATMQARVRHLAQHDPLTGLPNRFFCNDRLHRLLASASRKGGSVALMMVDIDRFKVVNDGSGHATGDEVLQEVAARLKGLVSGNDMVARVGGDEFVVLLADSAQEGRAMAVANKILTVFRKPFELDQRKLFVSASIGIAQFPADADNASDLFRAADLAMYRAKEEGRDNIQLYSETLGANSAHKLSLETDLRTAIAQGEFVLNYQPEVDLRDVRLAGVEALLRWQHPSRGLLYPADFLGLVDEIGMTDSLGEWVLDAACRQVRAWDDAGIHVERLAVNFSLMQLRPGIASTIGGILWRHRLEAGRLQVEITEDSVLDDVEASTARLTELKNLGITIALDDFGTGRSSLAYLSALPVDVVKIDRSFVRGLGRDPNKETLIWAISSLAHALNRQVIAEGVETEEELDLLAGLGCDEAQGFLFSRPLPASAALQRVLRSYLPGGRELKAVKPATIPKAA